MPSQEPAASAPESLARYTRVAVVLHWAIALLIIANVVLGLSADSLPDDWVRPVVDTHKSIGITVLGLAVLRIAWRLTHRPPALPVGYARWERGLSSLVHVLLYLLIFLLPLSGWLHDSAWKDAATHPMQLFGLFGWPRIGFVMDLAPDTREYLHGFFGTMHTWLGYVLYVVLALHVLGAFKHQWLDREAELGRMWV